jgi:signal transduction histidine kinase
MDVDTLSRPGKPTAASAPDSLMLLRDRLMATVSHEFRTPLTVIQASAGMIRRRVRGLVADERDLQRMLGSCERIEQATALMVAAIERVLLIGRLSAGEEPHLPRATLPGDVLLSLSADLQAAVDPPREVRLDLAGAQRMVWLDPLVLRQVAVQLLDNAFKYSSPEQAVHLQALIADGCLCMTVADQGVGIEAADLDLIFEPFHRGAAVRDLPGMGLGLPLVAQLLRLANGSIEFDSEPGRGTTVRVKLPLGSDPSTLSDESQP